MANSYKALLGLLPQAPLQIGEVFAVDGGVAYVELPGEVLISARGEASVGQKVFVRDGVIEGIAPSLPVEIITV